MSQRRPGPWPRSESRRRAGPRFRAVAPPAPRPATRLSPPTGLSTPAPRPARSAATATRFPAGHRDRRRATAGPHGASPPGSRRAWPLRPTTRAPPTPGASRSARHRSPLDSAAPAPTTRRPAVPSGHKVLGRPANRPTRTWPAEGRDQTEPDPVPGCRKPGTAGQDRGPDPRPPRPPAPAARHNLISV